MIKRLVSIIVPVYNSERTLERCVLSLMNQTYKRIEIILIDDGSTDCSYDICHELKKCDNRIVVIHQDNCGVSETRNIGISKSNGEFIMFVDSDDYVEHSFVESYLHYIDSDIDCVYGEFQRNDKNGALVGIDNEFDKPIYIINDKEIDWFSRENFHFSVWAVLFKSKLLENMQFDKQIFVGEDTLFFISVILNCKRIVHIPNYSYHYVQNEDSSFFGEVNEKKLTNIDAYEKIATILEKTSYDSSGAYRKIFDLIVYLFCKSTIRSNRSFNQYIRKKLIENKSKIRCSIIGDWKSIGKFCLLLYFPKILEKLVIYKDKQAL